MRILTLAVSAAALLALPAAAAPTAGGPTKTVAATSTAPSAKASPKAGTSKMAVCAKQWGALGDKGQAAYKDKAKGMKSKKGNSLSGYNAFTAECMKKG